jgi:benzoyl-CoA reductase/2-hydroxyglutaryl-CoA dehydratase subunit BcrC/BadD/HgdB
MDESHPGESALRRVGICSAGVPRELLWAMGCLPVRMFPTAAKPTLAEAYLPRNFCSVTKTLLAGYLDGDAPHLDAVIFTDEDDATRRLNDVWPTCVNIPVWGFLEVPRSSSPLAAERFARLLIALGQQIGARTGEGLTAERLHAAITVFNEQRRLLNEVRRHWLAGNLATPAYRRLRRLALTDNPFSANDALRQVLAGVTGDDGDRLPVAATEPTTPLPVLLLAELAAPVSLVRQIEAYNARVVGEVSGLDELAVNDPVPAQGNRVEDLAAGLANAYLNQPPTPRAREVARRLAYLIRLADERGAQAVICAYSKFCDPYLAEYPVLNSAFERTGRPTLLLELEDDTLGGQHRTRVEAFLEMVRSR